MAEDPQYQNCAIGCCENAPALVKKISKYEFEELPFERMEVIYKAGDIIFKQGDPLSHLACFREGMAKVYYERPDGSNMLISIVYKGSICGCVNMYTDDIHHLTVQALTDVNLCLISVKDIESEIIQSKEVAIELITIANESIIQYTTKLANLTYKNMAGRVADVFLYLKGEIYKSDSFTLNLCRQDLADLAAMTKESFIRTLKELKDLGIIKIERNLVEIIDSKALVKISNSIE